MKTMLLIVALTVIASTTGCGPLPQASLTVKVMDESEQPIVGARVNIRASDNDKNRRQNGKSDEGGKFTGQMPSFGFLNYSSGCEGYYSSWGEYRFGKGAAKGDISEWAKSRWEPWNPTVEVVLKRKGTPIPMHAKRMSIITLPASEKAIGSENTACL